MSDHPLIGTWRMVSYELESATGAINYPYGRDPTGYLIYAADGYMSVAFMTGGRIPYAGGTGCAARRKSAPPPPIPTSPTAAVTNYWTTGSSITSR